MKIARRYLFAALLVVTLAAAFAPTAALALPPVCGCGDCCPVYFDEYFQQCYNYNGNNCDWCTFCY